MCKGTACCVGKRDPLIGGDQQLVSVAFSLVKQFAVSERVPVALKGGVRWWSGRLDVSSLGTLLSSSILIFEVLLQGVDFVVEDGYDLLARDAFEVVQVEWAAGCGHRLHSDRGPVECPCY